MNRFQAQRHLLEPGNSEGAFLIRVSEKDNVGYVLSGEKSALWSVSLFQCSDFTTEGCTRVSTSSERLNLVEKEWIQCSLSYMMNLSFSSAPQK